MNTEQWGNIELPGLSDEELLNKNWNKITGAREAVKAREKNGWYEKNILRYEDLQYKERWKSSIKEAYENPELRQLQSDIHKGVTKTKEHAENIRLARLNAPPRDKSTKVKISNAQKGNTKRCQPMITPLGIFSSLKEAGQIHEANGLGNAVNHLRKRIKEQWEGYRNITKEEYTRLTGNEI